MNEASNNILNFFKVKYIDFKHLSTNKNNYKDEAHFIPQIQEQIAHEIVNYLSQNLDWNSIYSKQMLAQFDFKVDLIDPLNFAEKGEKKTFSNSLLTNESIIFKENKKILLDQKGNYLLAISFNNYCSNFDVYFNFLHSQITVKKDFNLKFKNSLLFSRTFQNFYQFPCLISLSSAFFRILNDTTHNSIKNDSSNIKQLFIENFLISDKNPYQIYQDYLLLNRNYQIIFDNENTLSFILNQNLKVINL